MKAHIEELLNQGYEIYIGDPTKETEPFYFLCTRNEEDQLLDGLWVCNATTWSEQKQKQMHCTYSTSRVHNMERHNKTGKHHEWRKNNSTKDDPEPDYPNKWNEKHVDNKSTKEKFEEKILLNESTENTDALSMMFSRIKLNTGIYFRIIRYRIS